MKQATRFALVHPLWGSIVAMAVVLVLAGTPALAANEAAVAGAAEQDAEAIEILMKMAGFMANAPGF